jgi:putative transposase
MLVAHKVELYVTKKQADYLYQCLGANRFAYNQLVELFNNSTKIPSKTDFNNKIKELRAKYEWMQELSTRVVRNTVDDISTAIKKAFTKEMIAKRKNATTLKGKRLGLPKFKKRGKSDSFSFREKEKFKVVNRKFKFEKFPKELGWLKLRQSIRFSGQLKQVTISLKAGKWFASFLIDTNDIVKQEPRYNDVVGVDLGIKHLATLSNGKVFDNIRSLQSKDKKLRKLNKKLSRQQKSSKNWIKTKDKLAKLYYYTTEARKSVLHNLTSYLVRNFKTICIEDLNVSGMLKNHKLARSISDIGFYEFRRQLKYKAKWYGREIVVVDRFFPSSKTCSNCGYIKSNLKLSDRIHECEKCGLKLDRDLNASYNLRKVATRSGDTINDCGELSVSYSVKQ